jgi:ABC-type glycerol-3-phosphate transport system substrate-binding protein
MKPTAASAALLAAALTLSACGGGGSPESNAADQLRDAADVSTPEAAPVLENGADRLEENGAANVGAEVQNILQDAGNAQSLNQTGNTQQ